jgi:hypothetical protein
VLVGLKIDATRPISRNSLLISLLAGNFARRLVREGLRRQKAYKEVLNFCLLRMLERTKIFSVKPLEQRDTLATRAFDKLLESAVMLRTRR